MGPELNHVEPMADKFVEAIVVCLKQRGVDRPDWSIFRLDKKWDAQLEIIRGALREMIVLDACDKF